MLVFYVCVFLCAASCVINDDDDDDYRSLQRRLALTRLCPLMTSAYWPVVSAADAAFGPSPTPPTAVAVSSWWPSLMESWSLARLPLLKVLTTYWPAPSSATNMPLSVADAGAVLLFCITDDATVSWLRTRSCDSPSTVNVSSISSVSSRQLYPMFTAVSVQQTDSSSSNSSSSSSSNSSHSSTVVVAVVVVVAV